MLARDLSGLAHVRAEVVTRELRNQVGKPFSAQAWTEERKALEDLDLFAQVSVTCRDTTLSIGSNELAPPSSGIALHYGFIELFQYFPTPTVKQSDQDGWMVGGAFAALNLLGWDIRAELQARGTLSPWLQAKEYAFYASAPWAVHWPVAWDLELVKTDSWDPLRSFHDRSLYGNFEFSHMTQSHLGGLVTGGFRAMEHTGAPGSHPWLSAGPTDWVPRLGAGVLYDDRDSKADTRRGIYQELRITQSGGWLGGPADYFECLWDARSATPIGPGQLRTNSLLRLRPGTIGFYDRLQQGGANTLRGYSPDSAAHGGQEWLGNIEWRQAMLERRPLRILGIQGFWALQWVLGSDGAFLWDKGQPHWDDYRAAAYVGVHLLVPAIDRVRFELGVNPRSKSWEFTIGLFEKALTQRWRSR